MADTVSAIAGHLTPGRTGPEGEPGVTLSEVTGFTLVQIAGWPDTMDRAAELAAKTAGVDTSPGTNLGPGRAVLSDGAALLRVEPLKFWALRRAGDPPAPDRADDVVCTLDLSHSRSWLRVGGTKAPTLLNQFLPIDLRDDRFDAGAVASSMMHHIGITLWRDGDGFNLLLPRSFAASLVDLLIESAAQHGLAVAAP